MVHIVIDGLLSGTIKDVPSVLDELFPNWKFVEESYIEIPHGWKCDFVDMKEKIHTIHCTAI